MNAYATRRDVYRYGLARGALGSRARLVASSLATTNALELEAHGFETDDEIVLRATDGGTLSSPLVAGAAYYAIRLTDSTFMLAAAPGGSEIDLTTDGVSMLVATALPFDDVLEAVSRMADTYMPHAVPLTAPYPVTVVDVVARIASRRLQLLSGAASDATTDIEQQAWKELARWAAGVPLRDAAATPSTNRAVSASLVGADPRGWGTRCLP